MLLEHWIIIALAGCVILQLGIANMLSNKITQQQERAAYYCDHWQKTLVKLRRFENAITCGCGSPADTADVHGNPMCFTCADIAGIVERKRGRIDG